MDLNENTIHIPSFSCSQTIQNEPFSQKSKTLQNMDFVTGKIENYESVEHGMKLPKTNLLQQTL